MPLQRFTSSRTSYTPHRFCISNIYHFLFFLRRQKHITERWNLHVCGVYLVLPATSPNQKRVVVVYFKYQNAEGSCLQDYGYGIAAWFWTADCEPHSLIFLFISETEEAFFNKTTENQPAHVSLFSSHTGTINYTMEQVVICVDRFKVLNLMN